MTPLLFRRPLQILAGGVAVLSLLAVGAVLAMAFAKLVPPAWITSVALYGLPVAFLLMLVLVAGHAAARRRTRQPGER
jgi:hypothetical protein